MDTFYLILFAAGVIYAVVTLFLGDLFDFRLDFGDKVPFLSSAVIATFVTVFGISGYVLERNAEWGAWPIVASSFVSAIILAFLMFAFFKWPAYKAGKSEARAAREMIGKTAEVVTVIKYGTKGEILYEHEGVQLSAPALVADGETVRQGEIVRIVDVSGKTFVVKKIGEERGETLLA